MWLNLTILIILVISCLIINSIDIHPYRGKKYIILLAAILLIAQSGLRNVAVGPDTYAYYEKFIESQVTSWNAIFANYKSVYIDEEGKDPGYYLVQKIFSSVIPNFQLFLFFIATIFFVAFFRVVNRYTNTKEEVVLAVLVYLSLFYSFFSITGCRQVLATALCLFSLDYIRQQRFILFLLLMLVAITIHKSAMLFIPFYFVSRITKPGYIFIVALVLMPSLISVSNTYALELAILSGSDNYLAYADEGGHGANTFIVFYVVLLTSLFIIQKRVLQHNYRYLLIYNALYFALLFLPLTYSSAALMRVVQYYSLFMTVGITILYKTIRESNKYSILAIFFTVVVLALGYKVIYSAEDYKFFWQYMALPDNY